MKTAVMEMSRTEAAGVVSNFVPRGNEEKAGHDIAFGLIEIDISKKLPENLTTAQAWALEVVLNHAQGLDELGVTKTGFSYAELMWKLRFNGVSPRWGKATVAMLKRVHKTLTPDAKKHFQDSIRHPNSGAGEPYKQGVLNYCPLMRQQMKRKVIL